MNINSHPTQGRTIPCKDIDQIERCFHESPYLALRDVRCTFNEGTVQLEGALPTYYLKQLAQEIIKQHECVEQVNNQIVVGAPA